MRIERIKVKNFRLLEDVEISFEKLTTVIVGRNNSGKTSLTEFFNRLIGEGSAMFKVEDFSAGARPGFINAKKLRQAGEKDLGKILAALPVISATLTIGYDPNATDLGPLSPFIIDLDPGCKTAIVRLDYRPDLAGLPDLLDAKVEPGDEDESTRIFRSLREAVPRTYALHVTAVDPTDPTNERVLDVKAVTTLVGYDFISAQRSLDQHKRGEPRVLGKLLEILFENASASTAAAKDQEIAAALKEAVSEVEQKIHGGFNEKLTALLPTFDTFGYPGLNDPHLRTETALNVASLLSEHTKVFYTGSHGVHLPEGYNGLGTRNLIYILLQLLTFHKIFRARPMQAGVHLIFIEEPEAHLHPQMQEVFIKQLTDAVATFSKDFGVVEWPVQFVVTTHSSHVANAATFEAIRYFLAQPKADGITRHTRVKDFRKGFASIPPGDRNFLQQYMTLTKCDLYFADKAILVEGQTERLLMPRICKLVDEGLNDEAKLARQYLSLVEIDGAHGKLFAPLLDFLELKALMVTDLDVVRLRPAEGSKPARWVKCPYSQGERTGNSTIKEWFDTPEGEQVSLEDLGKKSLTDKVKMFRCLAYQIHEEGSTHCGRSFEDALILANSELFGLAEGADAGDKAWEMAQELQKIETALRFAIQEPKWNVPRYIKEGLAWLSEPAPLPQIVEKEV
jgi:putative ATP-dependent endonuclease of OLD family